jgi:aspartate racemase
LENGNPKELGVALLPLSASPRLRANIQLQNVSDAGVGDRCPCFGLAAGYLATMNCTGARAMNAVGLVGGLGPESTIDYYRRILEAWEHEAPGTAPHVVIDSLDVRHALRLVAVDRPALVEYLLASIERLARAGVGIAAMTANTPHVVFDELAARSPVPLLSIVESCADEGARLGLRRLVLLGTRFTMEAPFYPEVLGRRGIATVVPEAEERAWLHEHYVGELLRGDFRDETRQRVVSLVERLRDAHAADGVILGGTELPLLLGEGPVAGLPALDTTALHVRAIVERLRSGG